MKRTLGMLSLAALLAAEAAFLAQKGAVVLVSRPPASPRRLGARRLRLAISRVARRECPVNGYLSRVGWDRPVRANQMLPTRFAPIRAGAAGLKVVASGGGGSAVAVPAAAPRAKNVVAS